ncbi:hypothetical protein C8J55DRAFT_566814 [Lentinula edodes]|uniref:Uncharacterized protein n=1 Tax=Lentinula lateritia TaxID=40482 RepID=A0A9W8ZSK1_9AGAR|nr:hypothetical protein C8J55DRAFT_566814 [Lentinula edodes]
MNPILIPTYNLNTQPQQLARFNTGIFTMKFSAILSAVLVAALGVTSVTAAAAADIAADPDSACRCPNNCSHKFGDSCKFYDNGNVISGSCVNGSGGLTCAT